MDPEFQALFDKLPEARCAKRAVAAGTYVGETFVVAVNECNRMFGKPQPGDSHTPAFCGRTLYADEDCEAALSLCQPKHAESELAIVIRNMMLQSEGIAWVAGHYYACRSCAAALRAIGVREIRVRELP
jgi:hypothetical protein